MTKKVFVLGQYAFLQSYTDYIGNDETNLLDNLATREWLDNRA